MLVVDDEALHRLVVRRILESDTITVEEAEDAVEARRFLATRSPDVAVLDISLPGSDGIDLCREILDLHPGCRVVMLTAFDSEDNKARSRAAGAAGYLTKPFSSLSLLRMIDELTHG